jgi:hypothetical protein
MRLRMSLLGTLEYFERAQQIDDLYFTEAPKLSDDDHDGRAEKIVLRHVPKVLVSEALRDVESAKLG